MDIPLPMQAATSSYILGLVSRSAALIVAVMGGLALLGWALDFETLKSVIPDMVTMKANTAACFVLSGFALRFSRSWKTPVVSIGLAAVVIAIALTTLFEYGTGRNCGIDELIFLDRVSVSRGLPPGRMAFATAIAFTMTGISIALVARHRFLVTAQFLTLGAVLIPGFSLLAYLFGERSITLTNPFTSLAINTAFAFAVLGVGILAECSESGPMSVFVADAPGGASLRRLLPLSVGLMVGLGFSAFLGARAGLYTFSAGMVLFAVLNSVVLTGAVWVNGWALNRAEMARRREHDWLQMTLQSIGDAVIATDRAGCVQFLNPIAETLTGWPSDEARGRPLGEVFRIINESTRVESDNPVARVLTTGNVVGLANHTILIARDGRERPIDDSAAPIKESDGRTTGVVLVFRDVTDRKRAEEELSQAARRKDEFLAMLAHELRNPLAAIGNAVAVAERSGQAEHRDWANQIIVRQIKHLTRLIDDLLDVSRISRGKIELRSELIEITPILESAAVTVGSLIDERRHTLDLEIDRGHLWVVGDPTRLEQVVVNLLNNAAKYSEDSGHIRLSASRGDGHVLVTIADDGVGIPPDRLPEMFELFVQGDRSLARSEGGLGIGLTVVKKLVELHGGDVRARSEGEGRGSEFAIRLPAAPEAPDVQPTPPPPIERTARKSRVLVVDDNVDTARGMARLLKLIGHDVATAHNGPDALELARDRSFEVILLDIGLPGMDGYEVASRLREGQASRDSMIVAVSGYGQDDDRRRSKEAGFDFHMIKPVDHEALIALMLADRQAPA